MDTDSTKGKTTRKFLSIQKDGNQEYATALEMHGVCFRSIVKNYIFKLFTLTLTFKISTLLLIFTLYALFIMI